MDDDVGVASDGRREVSVERNVEGVVFKVLFLLKVTSTEIHRHLVDTNKPDYIQK